MSERYSSMFQPRLRLALFPLVLAKTNTSSLKGKDGAGYDSDFAWRLWAASGVQQAVDEGRQVGAINHSGGVHVSRAELGRAARMGDEHASEGIDVVAVSQGVAVHVALGA